MFYVLLSSLLVGRVQRGAVGCVVVCEEEALLVLRCTARVGQECDQSLGPLDWWVVILEKLDQYLVPFAQIRGLRDHHWFISHEQPRPCPFRNFEVNPTIARSRSRNDDVGDDQFF